METMMHYVPDTISQPESTVIPDNDPETARRYYRWFTDTVVGDKWMRVVVKYLPDDAYVLTAFMTGCVR
jgi:hypothetical protein